MKIRYKDIICYDPPTIEIVVFDDRDHIMSSGETGAWDWLENE